MICPQCKGTGGPENNATDEDLSLSWKLASMRARAMLEQLRYPSWRP